MTPTTPHRQTQPDRQQSTGAEVVPRTAGPLDITRNGVWMRVTAPNARTPYWTDHADGRPLELLELLIGCEAGQIGSLRLAHSQAIAELMVAGFAAKDARDYGRARQLFTCAGRLCTEPLGHCPRERTPRQ